MLESGPGQLKHRTTRGASQLSNNANKNPSRQLRAAALFLLFILPSLYALVALVELDLRMGHGIGYYADYGKTAGQVALAIGFTVLYIIWLVVGTLVGVRVFKGHLELRWVGVLALVALLVMLPASAIFLLGVGHF